MRTVLKSCLLLVLIFTTSCGKLLDVYVNQDLVYDKPRKILYSQALGVSAMNSIVEDGGSYFDKVVFNSFANYNINAEPIEVNIEEMDSVDIVEACKSLQADGLLLTKYKRTYGNDQMSNQIALSGGGAMIMAYYNSKGEFVAAFEFLPPHKEDVKDGLRKGVQFGVKKLVKTCWVH